MHNIIPESHTTAKIQPMLWKTAESRGAEVSLARRLSFAGTDAVWVRAGSRTNSSPQVSFYPSCCCQNEAT